MMLTGCNKGTVTTEYNNDKDKEIKVEQKTDLVGDKENKEEQETDLVNGKDNIINEQALTIEKLEEEVKKAKKLVEEKSLSLVELEVEMNRRHNEANKISSDIFKSPDKKYAVVIINIDLGSKFAYLCNLETQESTVLNPWIASQAYWSEDSKYFILDHGTSARRAGELYSIESADSLYDMQYVGVPHWINNEEIIYATINEDIYIDTGTQLDQATDIIHLNVEDLREKTLYKGNKEEYYLIRKRNVGNSYSISKNLLDGTSTEIDIKSTYCSEMVLKAVSLANEENALLVYDGDIVLKIGEEEVIVRKNTDDVIRNTNGDFNVTYDVEELGIHNIISVTEYNPGMYTYDVVQRLYRYENHKLSSLWELEDLNFTLLHATEESISIGCSLDQRTLELNLNETEVEEVAMKLSDLKANWEVLDSEYWSFVKNNLVTSITECGFADVNSDGSEEMILSFYIRTVGASTPVKLREKGILIYDINGDVVLKDILFERDNTNKILESYFIGEI